MSKISFKIELEEFYMDEDQNNLEEELVKYIKEETIRSIWKKIEKKVEDQIQMEVKRTVESNFTKIISAHVNKIISSKDPIIKNVQVYDPVKQNYAYKDASIEEYIHSKFVKDTGWGSPNDAIEKLAKRFAEEMKNRYDLMFATQIVSKMNDQGLLKNEALAKLLES